MGWVCADRVKPVKNKSHLIGDFSVYGAEGETRTPTGSIPTRP